MGREHWLSHRELITQLVVVQIKYCPHPGKPKSWRQQKNFIYSSVADPIPCCQEPEADKLTPRLSSGRYQIKGYERKLFFFSPLPFVPLYLSIN